MGLRRSRGVVCWSLLLWTVLVGVGVVACGASTPALVVAPVEAPLSGPGAAALVDAGSREGAKGCERVLEAGPVVPTPSTCWINERVGGKNARLTYPCAGGAAVADFGTRFEGSVDGAGEVHLEATTTFPWGGDGCTWQSVQRVGGNLDAGELLYTYEEHPTEGDGCAPADCKARVSVHVGTGQ